MMKNPLPAMLAEMDTATYRRYRMLRRHMRDLWKQVSKPVKFPAPSRRRRDDHERPKAA
jgi:hypothetical protein